MTLDALPGLPDDATWQPAAAPISAQVAASAPSEAARVLLADGQALVRHALAGLLQSAFPGWTLQQAGSLAEIERALDTGAGCDLLLTELALPGMHGTASLRLLRQRWPALPVLVVTGLDDGATMLACLSAGAQGYVRKAEHPEAMLQAVRAVLAGGLRTAPFAPPSAVSAAASESLLAGLTGRQREVLRLLVDGCSTKDIARRLDLGLGTVKVHLNGVYQRLGARNRSEAVARFHAWQQGGAHSLPG